MSRVDDKIEEFLMHRGKKGMRWGFNDGDPNGKRTAGKDSEDLDEFEKELGELKGKVGDGPLDMLRYIVTGKTKKSKKKSLKDKASSSIDDLGKSIKDIKGKIGKGPWDMIKYIVTGKRKVQHSGLNEGLKLSEIDDRYKDIGRSMIESARKRS